MRIFAPSLPGLPDSLAKLRSHTRCRPGSLGTGLAFKQSTAATDLCGRGSRASAERESRAKSSWLRQSRSRTSTGDGASRTRTGDLLGAIYARRFAMVAVFRDPPQRAGSPPVALAAVRHASSWLLDQNLTTRRFCRRTSRHARAQSGGHLNPPRSTRLGQEECSR
jgi:hypothetical protein